MIKNSYIYFAAIMASVTTLSGCTNQNLETPVPAEISAEMTSTEQLSGQNSDEQKQSSDEQGSMDQATSAATSTAIDPSTSTAPALSPEQLSLYTACQSALQKLDQQSVLPDNTSVKEKPGFFMIQDIDADGTEDLILAWETSSSFGDRFSVYGYDLTSDSFHVKWNRTDSIKLFDLGTVLKPVPVNYGLSSTDTFYPYGFYQFHSENNTYQFQGYVDAWQKSYLQVDYAGNGYPSKIDTENAGMVYCITYCGEGADYVNDYSYSQSQYDQFCQETFGAQITTEHMTAFTTENVEMICNCSEPSEFR